jgi:two-component system, OmpR family, phosphate regulon sensor histidine kinase PhoR
MNNNIADILVVDDELGMREGIKRLFEAQGHHVDTADCGEAGIAKGTAREYDLYLLDLKMGDMDGVAVLGQIKKVYPEAICIIITAYASINTAVETTRLGAYHYVAKPFTPEEIQFVLDRALERRSFILEARILREERERRLLEVSQEKSRIRTIMNAIGDGLLVINQDGEVVLFNPRFLTLLRINQPLVAGQPVLALLPEDLRNQISEILAKKESLRGIEQEIVIQPPSKLVVMANTASIQDEKGRFLGVVSVLRDISELKNLENLKSQFVNMAAHELKSPLTAVQGYLEMVIDKTLGDVPDVYDGYLRRSNERCQALISLINDLLNISRMQAGTVKREIEQLDIGQVLQHTVEFYQNEIDKAQLTLFLKLEPSLWITADRDEIQRVFQNLISNAIKYNRPHGEIRILVKRDGHYVKISVGDTGIGMTPEEQERLFEEFFRAKNPLTRHITGTGLGLTIVKTIVNAYAGMIEVLSEYDKGTTFTVSLPVSEINSGLYEIK